MSQKEIILYNIMYHGAEINENAVITVTTHESATQILELFKENKMELPLNIIRKEKNKLIKFKSIYRKFFYFLITYFNQF